MIDYSESLKIEFQNLLESHGMVTLLTNLAWKNPSNDVERQTVGNWDILVKDLIQNKIYSFLYPMHILPLNRDPHIQIAAVSKRINKGYHLQNRSDIRNLAFFGESHVISYNDPLVALYVRAINEKVQLNKVKYQDLQHQDIAIHLGKYWTDSEIKALSLEEFIPRPAEGIYALICRKDNVDLRQKFAHLHDVESAEVNNIERGLQVEFTKRQDKKLIGVRVQKDDFANFHATVATSRKLDNQTSVDYFQLSQSTTHLFLQKIIALIQA